eukprot:m.123220 g.123220  ORF g.123220 m.123220 type:complete len:310 (-) comp52149_c0_seq3:19-948(-)
MAAEHALFAFRPAVRALAATCAPTRMLAVQVSARVYRAPCTPITVRTLSSFKDRKDKIMNSAQEKFTGLHESQKNLQKSEVRLMRDSPGVIADDFVPIPPEHRSSIVSVKGLGERWNAMKKIARATFSIGSIKRLDKEFKPIEFAEFAQTQFISAQEALARDDKTTLREIVTDTAFLALRKEFRQHTWKLESVVERPRIVHATMISLGDKKNLMAQVTVRLHLRQILALRDVAGRVIKGSETQPKNVVDFLVRKHDRCFLQFCAAKHNPRVWLQVLERHISLPNSKWKIAGKVFPEFMKPVTPASSPAS